MISEELKRRMQKIRLIAMDVDGVLTEGKLLYTQSKQELCSFYIKDGMGLAMARRAGFQIALISGRESEVVALRAKDLKISELYQGVVNKLEAFSALVTKYDLEHEQICFIGDDVNDLPVLQKVGLAVGVSDAVEEVKKIAHYVTALPGGGGAVREIIDKILYAQGLYKKAIDFYLS